MTSHKGWARLLDHFIGKKVQSYKIVNFNRENLKFWKRYLFSRQQNNFAPRRIMETGKPIPQSWCGKIWYFKKILLPLEVRKFVEDAILFFPGLVPRRTHVLSRAGHLIVWFSDGPGRSRSRTLSLPRLMDFIQGHVRDVMTPLFFPRQ